jgi:DNA primase
MAFSPQFLEELRNRLSIADVIGRKLRLQKRGREYHALCPFHNEKTPSFTISEEKGFFHCFGCGAHGDVVGFVMRNEGLSFPEAVEKLAQEAGLQVPVSAPEDRQRAQRQTSGLAVLEAAAAWYEERLRSAAGRPALDYLKGRGLEETTIARFRLGYAPDSRGALKSALTGAGFPEALLLEAGLLIQPDNANGRGGAPYDRFRGRVMFPITDRRGRVIAFGGRILGDGEPKYLNSPETPLFHKGRTLYGLAQALKAAREKDEIIVAEGYMDVIALAQAGFAQSVAPLGTALTEEQMVELWRLAPEPVLCFDGDAAGERAAARAADRALPLLKPGQSLRFALLPPGEDPDSLVREQGGAALREVIDRARPLVAVLWQMEATGHKLDTPERRAGFRERLRERLRRIADRTVYQDYRIEMDRRLDAEFGNGRYSGGSPAGGFPGRSGWGRGSKLLPGQRTSAGGEAARRGMPDPSRLQQEIALAVAVNHPDLLAQHAEELAQTVFPTGKLDQLRQALVDAVALHPELDSQMLRHYLSQQGFSGVLDALLHRTKDKRFTLPDAPPEQASEGFLHILALMREREARRETDAAARRLAEDMTDEALAQFEAKQRVSLEGESRRRDLDR